MPLGTATCENSIREMRETGEVEGFRYLGFVGKHRSVLTRYVKNSFLQFRKAFLSESVAMLGEFQGIVKKNIILGFHSTF